MVRINLRGGENLLGVGVVIEIVDRHIIRRRRARANGGGHGVGLQTF